MYWISEEALQQVDELIKSYNQQPGLQEFVVEDDHEISSDTRNKTGTTGRGRT